MSDEFRLPDLGPKRGIEGGPADRVVRFEKASRAIAESLIRNRTPEQGGSGIPVVVEGNRDEEASGHWDSPDRLRRLTEDGIALG